MFPSAYRQRVHQYATIQTASHIDAASPHQLIEMLMEGCLARINSAKGAMSQRDFEAKNTFITKAVDIVSGLSEALDREKGGELADNLQRLYAYMIQQLFLASAKNSPELLDEVATLMREVKSAWSAIKP